MLDLLDVVVFVLPNCLNSLLPRDFEILDLKRVVEELERVEGPILDEDFDIIELLEEVEGLDVEGLDIVGLDVEGFENDGLETEGLDVEGLENDGLETEGLDVEGLENDGLETEGLDIDGLLTDGLFIVGDLVTDRCLTDGLGREEREGLDLVVRAGALLTRLLRALLLREDRDVRALLE